MYGTGAYAPTTNTPGTNTTPGNYGAPPATGTGTTTTGTPGGNVYNSADASYIRNLPTAYTPEQVLLMKNNARNQSSSANQGNELKIRELMAQQGMGGSGFEAGNIYNQLASQDKSLGSTLAGIDINAANTDLSNKYAKGGLLNQLMGVGTDEEKLGEMGRQFDVGQYNDLYKWGNETDYQRYLDRLNKNEYGDQMRQFLQLLGLG
jgi:hypothetical protein